MANFSYFNIKHYLNKITNPFFIFIDNIPMWYIYKQKRRSTNRHSQLNFLSAFITCCMFRLSEKSLSVFPNAWCRIITDMQLEDTALLSIAW